MSPSDAMLMDRWRRRSDAEAFAEIVGRHVGMVYGTCRRLLGDSEAEDVVQECFIKLSQSELRHGQAIGGWLHRVATNACLDRLRATQRRQQREEAFATRPRQSEISWDDLQEHVDEAVAALPDDLRLPIIYHFLEGRTHQDVARDSRHDAFRRDPPHPARNRGHSHNTQTARRHHWVRRRLPACLPRTPPKLRPPRLLRRSLSLPWPGRVRKSPWQARDGQVSWVVKPL